MDQHSRWSICTAFATGVVVSITLQIIYGQIVSKRQKEETGHEKSNALSKPIPHSEHPSLDVSSIKEGIEGCIGNTPLIRIKSLSEETGCEILAKAEFLNGAGNSPKDRVASSIISMVVSHYLFYS